MHNLLSWAHPGFSVFAGPPVDAAALATLESQCRYITRPALAMDALEKVDDGTLSLETPPDPRTSATQVALDPLEWIQRITAHIPDPASHCQRFYVTRHVSDSTAPIRTGVESSAPADKPTAPLPALPRPRPGTIPNSPGRPAAPGPGWSGKSSKPLPTARDTAGTHLSFRVTHPFHPWFGQQFSAIECRHGWRENRVYFRDRNGQSAALPIAWTSLAAPDPFLIASAGNARFRLQDLLELVDLIQRMRNAGPTSSSTGEGGDV